MTETVQKIASDLSISDDEALTLLRDNEWNDLMLKETFYLDNNIYKIPKKAGLVPDSSLV
jgi:hypothetical protein